MAMARRLLSFPLLVAVFTLLCTSTVSAKTCTDKQQESIFVMLSACNNADKSQSAQFNDGSRFCGSKSCVTYAQSIWGSIAKCDDQLFHTDLKTYLLKTYGGNCPPAPTTTAPPPPTTTQAPPPDPTTSSPTPQPTPSPSSSSNPQPEPTKTTAPPSNTPKPTTTGAGNVHAPSTTTTAPPKDSTAGNAAGSSPSQESDTDPSSKASDNESTTVPDTGNASSGGPKTTNSLSTTMAPIEEKKKSSSTGWTIVGVLAACVAVVGGVIGYQMWRDRTNMFGDYIGPPSSIHSSPSVVMLSQTPVRPSAAPWVV